jgi:hypothetical protein
VAAKENWKPGSWRSPGRGQAVEHRGLAIQQESAEDQHAHDGRAQDRRLGPHHGREGHDGAHGGRRGRPTACARHRQEPEDRCGQKGHVEAGHGQDVIDPRAAKPLVEVARERRAIPE